MNGSYVILGANGQVGRAWSALPDIKTLTLNREECDLNRRDFLSQLDAKISNVSVIAIINAAAYTQVDKAEGEGRAEAMRVNGEAVGKLAAWCKKRDIPLVHYSTDYVFDGSGTAPHREDDATKPINAYGESKLTGEKAITASGGRYLIFRTSWVYDAEGKNFFTTIRRLIGEKDALTVVSDQVGVPTYALHLAQGSFLALTKALKAPKFPSGLYHLCNGGETSWHGFANAIFTLARSQDSGIRCQRINPVSSAEYPSPAARPRNSRLDCSKAKQMFGVALPEWSAGLKECFDIYTNNGRTELPHCRAENH